FVAQYTPQVVKDVAEASVEAIKYQAQTIKNVAGAIYDNTPGLKRAVRALGNAKRAVQGCLAQGPTKCAGQAAAAVGQHVKAGIKQGLHTARQALHKTGDWVQNHKALVTAGVGLVAGAAFCGATAGIGCAILVGAAAAGGVQLFANATDSSGSTKLFDNVL